MILMSFNYYKKKKIVFFGDSITAAGIQPGGYIKLMDSLILQEGQSANYELAGAGVGGDKIYDLYLRMEEDVLKQNPDIVVMYIGVNDVWHKQSFGTGTDPDKFVKFYRAIIQKLQARNIKVVLCTPATIGERTDFSNQQDGDLNKYSQLIRDLAKDLQCGLVDFRDIFHRYELSNNPGNKAEGILTSDGVHLNAVGNQLAADHMLEALLALK
jgi:lysophospholipase L1-like esterase